MPHELLSAEPEPAELAELTEPPAAPPRAAPVRTSVAESRASVAFGCGGTVGETPAGPAIPGVTVAVRPPRPFLPLPFFVSAAGAPNSPSAARAWEIRIASMVMSWRISERLQARSASSHIVVRCTGLVPVTSARATIAPLGARSRPLR